MNEVGDNLDVLNYQNSSELDLSIRPQLSICHKCTENNKVPKLKIDYEQM